MYYIQYYTQAVPNKWNNYQDKLIEACGDRAVIILDGRESRDTHHVLAKLYNGCNRPKYSAYQLMRGETFTRSQPITDVIPL